MSALDKIRDRTALWPDPVKRYFPWVMAAAIFIVLSLFDKRVHGTATVIWWSINIVVVAVLVAIAWFKLGWREQWRNRG